MYDDTIIIPKNSKLSTFLNGYMILQKPFLRISSKNWAQKVPLPDAVTSSFSKSDLEKISRDKMTKDDESQVCHMVQSPFRILKMAAQGKLQEVEKLYYSDRTRIGIADNKGWTAAHHAAAHDRAEVIEFLSKHEANLNELSNDGDTPLHVAVRYEAINAINKLLTCGANPNIKDSCSRAPLHLAVFLNKIAVLEAIVEHSCSVNINEGDEQGRTPLHIAALYDYDEAAKILIEKHNVCPKKPCNNGFYPIHLAAKNASIKVLEVILRWAEKRGCERKKMISVPDLEGNVPLHLAVHGGEKKAVELCLNNGANISWIQQDNSTPVHLACSQGAFDIVKLMFELQPQEKQKALETQDAQGMTPLHCAAMFDHSELVLYLLQQGASVDVIDKEHRSPLLLAASQKCWRSVEILLNYGADPGIRDSSQKNILHVIIINGGSITDIMSFHQTSVCINTMTRLADLLNEQDALGCSPMHYASKSGQIRSLISLIQLGASVRIKNEKNESPLHFAARYGRYNTARQLLDSSNGFLIMNESDGNGRTALHIASEEGHTRVVQLLLSKGALLHRDNQGRTPLHLAAWGGHNETITTLLTVWGHLLNQTDKDGNTPLHMAVKNNKSETVSQLLSLNCKFMENHAGYKPIDYAIQFKLQEAAIAIVTHERGIWHQTKDIEKYSHTYGGVHIRKVVNAFDNRPAEVTQSPSEIHGCVCIALIKTLPKVFEAALNQAISRANVKEDSKDYYVKYAFYPLQLTEDQISILASLKKDPTWRPPPLFSCNAMVQSGRVDLLMHPLTQKFLEMKWHAYGMYIHLLNLFVYLLFLGMVTMFSAGVLGNNDVFRNRTEVQVLNGASFKNVTIEKIFYTKESYDTFSLVLAFGILFFSIIGIMKELFQIYQHRMKYISDAINAIEWILYSTSICMVLPAVLSTSKQIIYSEQQYNSAAIAVFTAWFTLLLYFQRFDHIGIYIVMFLEILNTLLKVLAVFSVLIVAFGLAFYILLAPGNHLSFSSIPLTMIRTFAMMLAEIDLINSFILPYFDEGFRSNAKIMFPKTTFSILFVFMILMPILLMNLLIGLAVGDIESVKKNAQLKRVAMQVELHTGLENKLPTYLIKKVNKQEIIVYPNETITRSNFFHRICVALNFCTPFQDQFQDSDLCEGGPDDLFLEEFNHQRRFLRDIKSQLDQQTKLLRLMMQKMEIQSEADETDEGVCFQDLIKPTSRTVKRWSTSANFLNSRKISQTKM